MDLLAAAVWLGPFIYVASTRPKEEAFAFFWLSLVGAPLAGLAAAWLVMVAVGGGLAATVVFLAVTSLVNVHLLNGFR